MENVLVSYKGKTKLVPFSSENLEELKQKIRRKFPDIPDGRFEIQAQVKNYDGKKISVDDDEDLEQVKNQLETLHIRSLSVGTETAPVVADETYRIDRIPDRDSSIVQEMMNEFKAEVEKVGGVGLHTELENIRDAADLFQLAATAGNTGGANLHYIEEKSNDTITFLLQLFTDVDVYYTRCTSSCKSVLNTVMVAAQFHMEELDDIAIKELAKLGKVSSDMASLCKTLVEKVDGGLALVKDIKQHVAGEVDMQRSNRGELGQLPVKIEKKNLDIAVKRENLEASKTGSEQRNNNSAEMRESLNKATTAAAGMSAAVTTAVAAGIKTGALAMTFPVVGVPLAMLAATGTLLFACKKQTSDINAQQVADEDILSERRREEAAAQMELLDLTLKLQELKDVEIEHVLECLHQVSGQLRKLHSTLFAWKSFWEKLAIIFFQRQQETEERFVDYANEENERLHSILSGKGFEKMLIEYLARWVAFQEHCEKSQAMFKANIDPLHQLMERNLTQSEARAELPNRARAICEKKLTDC
ncbi:uncharacterized protein LOC135485482 [Lineus longissimus]|uniref:uncharacterized protein LOC135485482 n=1 Tax=Lineus longissimus TaxID=88925 RepID=UPI002B4D9AEB